MSSFRRKGYQEVLEFSRLCPARNNNFLPSHSQIPLTYYLKESTDFHEEKKSLFGGFAGFKDHMKAQQGKFNRRAFLGSERSLLGLHLVGLLREVWIQINFLFWEPHFDWLDLFLKLLQLVLFCSWQLDVECCMFGLMAQNLFPKKSVMLLSLHWTSRGRRIWLEASVKCRRDSIWIVPALDLRLPVPTLFQIEAPVSSQDTFAAN